MINAMLASISSANNPILIPVLTNGKLHDIYKLLEVSNIEAAEWDHITVYFDGQGLLRQNEYLEKFGYIPVTRIEGPNPLQVVGSLLFMCIDKEGDSADLDFEFFDKNIRPVLKFGKAYEPIAIPPMEIKNFNSYEEMQDYLRKRKK